MLAKLLVTVLIAVATCTLATDAFGQDKRKKPKFNLPEVDDEVLIAFRQRKTHDKYANQEISYRKKTKAKRGVTHDPEFEDWANRRRKNKTTRNRKH